MKHGNIGGETVKLRAKVFLAFGLALLILIALLVTITWKISLTSYTELEQQDMRRNVERVENAIKSSWADLDSIVFDWSSWDDTYEYMIDRNKAYEEDNLDDYVHAAFDADIVLYATAEGEIVYGYGFDSEEETVTELSPETRAVFGPGSVYYFSTESWSRTRSGLSMLPDGLAIIASAPILTNKSEGPMHGTFIMARYIDEVMQVKLAEQTQLSLSILPIGDTEYAHDPGDGRQIDYPQDNVIRGHSVINDIFGKPVVDLAVESPRAIYQKGLDSLKFLIASLLIAGLVFGAIIWFFLEKSVLSRVAQLGKRVRQIARGGDLSLRTNIVGKDELAGLGKDVNDMLSALEQKHLELERSNGELEQFAYVASHDLQEPLRKIQSFGERLEKKFGDSLGEDGALYIERMQDSAARMRSLIQDLLSYSRISTQGKDFKEVDLNTIASEVISDLEVRLENTGGTVETGDLPTIKADPMQMRQLIQNLVGNALKFSRPGVAPVVKVDWKPMGSRGELAVSDNGIGFEQKYADRIFSVFQRLHGRGEYEGTGMGLAIVRKIAERHEGNVSVTSEPDIGTTFTVSLPIDIRSQSGFHTPLKAQRKAA